MKLKKAMKLYPIEVIEKADSYPEYRLGDRQIYYSTTYREWRVNPFTTFESEKQAVAWLIEGALPNYVVAETSQGDLHLLYTCPYCGRKL